MIGSRPHPECLSQTFVKTLDTPDFLLLLASFPVVLEHPRILTHILALDLQSRFRLYRFQHEVVVAVWAIFVAVVKVLYVLPETLFALFAGEDHLEGGL